MMASFQKTNFESSILFIQQEHANTLKALHEEIATLQKKCTELSLKLAMGDLAHGGAEDHNAFTKLDEELSVAKKKNKEMEKQLQDKNYELLRVRNQVTKLEKDSEIQLKAKKQEVSSLELELDTKTKTILNLMAELRSLKSKQTSGGSTASAVPGESPSSVKHSSGARPVNCSDLSDQTERMSLNEPPAAEKPNRSSKTKADAANTNVQPVSYLLRSRTKKPASANVASSANEEISKVKTENQASSSSPRDHVFGTPVPPKDGAPRIRRRAYAKTPDAATADENLRNRDIVSRSAGPKRPSSSRKIAEEVVPDPAPFLATKESLGTPKATSRKPKLLPPIPTRKSSRSPKNAFEEKAPNEGADAKQPAELPVLVHVDKLTAAVDVLSLDKTNQVDVRKHPSKYNSTANCN